MNNNFPKITIIIATYNSEKTIKHCLESCLSQNYSNKELIIADAKSTDGTMKIIKEFNSPDLVFFQSMIMEFMMLGIRQLRLVRVIGFALSEVMIFGYLMIQ